MAVRTHRRAAYADETITPNTEHNVAITIQPYAIHMAFTATVLSPDADTQATVESDWEAGAEHKYEISIK